jgi:hypothetical protein
LPDRDSLACLLVFYHLAASTPDLRFRNNLARTGRFLPKRTSVPAQGRASRSWLYGWMGLAFLCRLRFWKVWASQVEPALFYLTSIVSCSDLGR